MRLANIVRKYATSCLSSLELMPNSWGDAALVESQYILSLELLAISSGKDVSFVTERYRVTLNGECVSLAAAGKSSDEIVAVLLSIKQEIECM